MNEIFSGKIKFIQANDEGFLEIFEQESNIARQKSAKQPDTTDMSDLEHEESAAQKKKQVAKGLKKLTPNQMLSTVPICLAQLKAGNNSEKLWNEMKLGNYCILFTSQKNLQNNSINVWLTLFKDGNNFH